MRNVRDSIDIQVKSARNTKDFWRVIVRRDNVGDRGNIVVDGVWFYTHWGGADMPKDLKNALERGRDRWDDGPYLARIIFCEMLGDAKELKETTSYGISLGICDNEHDILVVDTKEQKIKQVRENGNNLTGVIKEWTFEEFLKAKYKESD